MLGSNNPVPFKIQVEKVPHHAYEFSEKDTSVLKTQSNFPNMQSVLWNRKAFGEKSMLGFSKEPNKLELVINIKTLELAYNQLCVHSGDMFQGFLAGQIDFEQDNNHLEIQIDRFDPGRESQNKVNTEVSKIPTAILPGDLCVPVTLQHGMAYIDHKSTETYTTVDFLKAFHILSDCLSHKNTCNLNQLLSIKIKCSFTTSGEQVLAYISACGITISMQIELTPINQIPIIPTALARNLEESLSLSNDNSQIKTGFMTMDQTRKLLLVLESDPKATTLPLIGVWISGVDDAHCPEVWACCMRFFHNKAISERVSAPPQSFLLLLFSPINANPLFYEFTKKSNNHDETKLDFNFVSMCEGVPLQQVDSEDDDDGICFELTTPSSGLIKSNFQTALARYHGKELPIQQEPVSSSSNISLDDSLPKNFHEPISPHPQATLHQPSSLDISLCESLNSSLSPIEEPTIQQQPKSTTEPIAETSPKQKTQPTSAVNVPKEYNMKYPRPTKASIIRMNLNKPNQVTDDKKRKNNNRLAINFDKSKCKSSKPKSSLSKEEVLRQVDQFIQKQNDNLNREMAAKQKDTRESLTGDRPNESVPRVPVGLRHEEPLQNTHKTLSVVLEPTYCPENYSDFEERFETEESFHIPKTGNRDDDDSPCSSTVDEKSISDEGRIDFDKEICNDGIEQVDYPTVKPTDQIFTPANPSKGTENPGVKPSRKVLPTSLSNVSNAEISTIIQPVKHTSRNKNDRSIEDATSKEKDELYKLLYQQQSQLTALQNQLQVFMNHQEKLSELSKKRSEEEKESEEEGQKKVRHDEERKETQTLMEMQNAQQNQLQELQKQVQVFLEATNNQQKQQQEEEERKTISVETSVQCSTTPPAIPSPPSPPLISTGVNTGRSLLWPTENLAITQSDTSLRGTQQAVLPNSSTKPAHDVKRLSNNNNNKPCPCCRNHFEKMSHPSYNDHKLPAPPTPPHRSTTTAPMAVPDDSSFHDDTQTSSVSDLQTVDIPSINNTTDTSQSITSTLSKVDMPVFEENSQQETPTKNNGMADLTNEWERSPQLGESASMLVEKRRREEQQHDDEDTVVEENLLNNKQFYQQMMNQVQKLIIAQSDENDHVSHRQSDDENPLPIPAPKPLSPEEKLEHIRSTTVKELQKMIPQDLLQQHQPVVGQMQSNDRQRSMSAAINSYPKINYTSMSSVDDTFYDYATSTIDKIASKYVSQEIFHQQQEITKNKTVKFEGVYKWQTSNRNGITNKNMASVNFSCNMSIASKKYLQKYSLEASDDDKRKPFQEGNGRPARIRSRDANQENEENNGKENKVLDYKKLQSLPKLK
ncbi:SCL-interrupting locus protein homolog [Clytia hemisphaerica]|uniref:STIL N-terminal domain-containing protein n=1 Tax=Clytia hemisphaerica TaxID=252671 RepID=A0A7M5V9S2_9CNID